MNVKKILGLLAIALVIFFVLTQPGTAANAVDNILGMLQDAAESATSFFTNVVS